MRRFQAISVLLRRNAHSIQSNGGPLFMQLEPRHMRRTRNRRTVLYSTVQYESTSTELPRTRKWVLSVDLGNLSWLCKRRGQAALKSSSVHRTARVRRSTLDARRPTLDARFKIRNESDHGFLQSSSPSRTAKDYSTTGDAAGGTGT